jgi:hypothetical protein
LERGTFRSLCRTGSLQTVARELRKGKTDLVGVQEVGWQKGRRIVHFATDRGRGIIGKGQVFFVHEKIASADRRVEFIGDRMSCVILRGRWCNIIVLNVHAPCEDTGDDVKGSFYEELGRVSGRFRR